MLFHFMTTRPKAEKGAAVRRGFDDQGARLDRIILACPYSLSPKVPGVEGWATVES